MKSCMIIGKRRIEKNNLENVRLMLKTEILNTIKDGYYHFVSSFTDGIELTFADVVAELKETQNITLEAAIPYRNRISTKNENFQRLLSKCNIIGVHSEKYSPNCFRNTAQIALGFVDCIIVVRDNKKRDSVYELMKYAKSIGKDVRQILIS